MSNFANYVATPKSPQVRLTTANANRDGSGTIVDVYPNGGAFRIDDVKIKANGTTTTGMVRLYKHDGTSYKLVTEVVVAAIIPSATVPAFEATLADLGWCFQAGHKFAASTEKGEQFEVHVTRGGDF